MTSDNAIMQIHDPLYGVIDISQTENALIHTHTFMRLHRIRQLSHACVVYPSAVHTIYEHSLGAMHMAGTMCDNLHLGKEKTRLVRLAALLHDVGHGPFSHLFESVLKGVNDLDGSIHEHITKIMLKNDPEIRQILGKDRLKIIELLQSFKPNVRKDWRLMSDIVSGSLDADKLDYIQRDSYKLGVDYGKFDLVRMMNTICPTPNQERLGVHIKGLPVVKSYRLAHHFLTAQVYEHSAKLAADQMFLHALNEAIHVEGIISPRQLHVSSKSFLSFYKTLDDDSIVNMITTDSRSKVSKKILGDIRARRLLKRVYELDPALLKDKSIKRMMFYPKEKLSAVANDIRKKMRLKKHELIVYESSATFKLYGDHDIPYVDKNNDVRHMNTPPTIHTDGGIMLSYVFGPEKKRDLIRAKFAAHKFV